MQSFTMPNCELLSSRSGAGRLSASEMRLWSAPPHLWSRKPSSGSQSSGSAAPSAGARSCSTRDAGNGSPVLVPMTGSPERSTVRSDAASEAVSEAELRAGVLASSSR